MTGFAAIILTGAPGAGKSVTIEALSDELAVAGIEHGAIESEQLAWGHPWLAFHDMLPQLRAVLVAQRNLGRRLFLVTVTAETDEDLEALIAAIGAERVLVVGLRAAPDTVVRRVLQREPEEWAGRRQLAANARHLAVAIPSLRRLDMIVDTDDREPVEIAHAIREAMEARGWTPGREEADE